MADFTLKVNRDLSGREDTIAAFLDVEGAYDHVQCDILLDKLASIGCWSKLVQFIRFSIYERVILTEFLKDRSRLCHGGVSQGGVLSLLLYSIYVKGITLSIPGSVSVSQFADDIAVYCSFGSADRTLTLMQNTVAIMAGNLFQIGLWFEPTESDLLHVNDKGIKPGESSKRICYHQTNSTDTAQFLVMIDYKFNFLPHLQNVKRQCTRRANPLRKRYAQPYAQTHVQGCA